MTMMFGYRYNVGKRIGYNISFNNFILYNVSASDKARIIAEIKRAGYSKNEIFVEKIEN